MDKENNPKIPWWQPGMQLFLKLSSWIGGPVIVAVFVGKYLDRKFNTAPWLLLASVGVSFIVSMIALVILGLKEMKKIDQENQSSKFKDQK